MATPATPLHLSIVFSYVCSVMISCWAKFIREDVVELPCGREFLSQPITVRGEYFITFYFDGNNQVKLVRLVEACRLRKILK